MGNIKTPITGISTTTAYEEGATYQLVNLRPKNGGLHPVAPRKIMQELSQKYDIVFVHQNNDYKNWIGVINDEGYSSVYWDILSEQPKSIQSYIQDKIHSIQQIGNTISLVTSDNIYYLFYQNSNYTFLGVLPSLPAISMGTSNEMSHATLYYINEYPNGGITPDIFIDATKGMVNKAIDLLVNGGTNSGGEEIGGYGLQLFDAHYIRYAFRLYDGTLTKHSPPILVMPVKDILDIKKISYEFTDGFVYANESKVDVYGYRIYMHYDLSGFDNWKDIIKSVDIFLSQPVGISNIENIRKDMPTTNSGWHEYNLLKELTPESLKNVANTSLFYFIRTLDMGGVSPANGDTLPTRDKTDDISRLENLIYQEVMSDDNFSHHKYGAEVSYTYNNRLHLGNVKTTFFKGFNANYFQWITDYNGVKVASGQVSILCIEVEIQAGTSLEKVYSFYSQYVWAPKLFASAFLSYPDPRAKRITIYEISREETGQVWTKVFTAQLEPHNLLNLAYYLSNGLQPIVSSNIGVVDAPSNTSKVISLSEPNKIKVSELSNPLNFPNINTYQVGNGTILTMSTNAMNVSDRNYGQYPLYVFTTQGIWNLNVGSAEVVYSTQSAPTSTEAPTNSIVESTPFGVAFVSTRGLMIINGQNVTFISPQIEQPYRKIEQETNAKIEELLHPFEKQTFSKYLENMSDLVYNPYENELIICNKESGFNYVLNFYIQSFYQSTEIIENVVKNTFPDLYVIGENKLKHYLESETKRTHVSFMLRPLLFGNDRTKWFSRLEIPFTLYDVEKMFVGVYASSDKVKFIGRYGNFYEAMNRAVDYTTKTMASNTGRYFLISFAAIASDESYIEGIDPTVEVKYKNM